MSQADPRLPPQNPLRTGFAAFQTLHTSNLYLRQRNPLTDHISGYIFLTFFDCADQSFVIITISLF